MASGIYHVRPRAEPFLSRCTVGRGRPPRTVPVKLRTLPSGYAHELAGPGFAQCEGRAAAGRAEPLAAGPPGGAASCACLVRFWVYR